MTNFYEAHCSGNWFVGIPNLLKNLTLSSDPVHFNSSVCRETKLRSPSILALKKRSPECGPWRLSFHSDLHWAPSSPTPNQTSLRTFFPTACLLANPNSSWITTDSDFHILTSPPLSLPNFRQKLHGNKLFEMEQRADMNINCVAC